MIKKLLNTKISKENKKGFTLAELLIVVAIIGVLVAISIPIFTAQLNKSKYATDSSNARSIYAEMTADYLATGGAAQGSTGKFQLTATKVQKGTAIEITSKAPDGTSNTYKFSGIVGIDFTYGTTDKAPSVTIAACEYNDNKAVTFGGGTQSTTTPEG